MNSASADNATQLGGVAANRFVQQDASGNVSIAGGLTVAGTLSLDTVNAQTQYNLGGNRVLAANPMNASLSLGLNSGSTAGAFNTFLGSYSGQANTNGAANTFVGNAAGLTNTTGSSNSFFGATAGGNNVTGSSNSFFGRIHPTFTPGQFALDRRSDESTRI